MVGLWLERGLFYNRLHENREHFFGEIKNGKMILSHTGDIADVVWHEIPHHASNVELGDFAVMPNHIHGILILDKPAGIVETGHAENVETGHALSLRQRQPQSNDRPDDNSGTQSCPTIGQQRFQNIGKNSVSSIVGSYKSAVTKHANRLGFENGWQPRFHDHIIRNEMEYRSISEYIRNNPQNWEKDGMYG